MLKIRQTDEFKKWFTKLRDRRAQSLISQRIVRVQSGNMGDVKFIENIGELRIFHGPGYRLYFVVSGEELILLCGGDKSSQSRDIVRAKSMAKEI